MRAFFRGLTQKSGTKDKVPKQQYIDSENFKRKYWKMQKPFRRSQGDGVTMYTDNINSYWCWASSQ